MRSRIPAIARKEFRHIIRDWRSLGMILFLPIVMIMLFGYAITFDVRNVRLAVYDADGSRQSRELIRAFTSSGYFIIAGWADSERDLSPYLEHGNAQVALSIPRGYGRGLIQNKDVRVAVLVDGTQPNNANIASGYVDAILTRQRVDYAVDFLRGFGMSQPPKFPPINVKPRFWYNPEMRSQNYIVPGLIATIMMVMTALLTSLTIVRERERGSLELLLATPVRTHEIMIGKLLPYFAVGMVDSLMIVVIGIVVFGMPFAGSFGLFLLGTSLFAMAGLGVGILISTIAGNQVFAMQVALLSTLLPSFLLSGFMFAIRNMPEWLRAITYVVTARYYIVIVRGIFLKGIGLQVLWPQFLYLLVLAILSVSLAVKKFHKKIG